MRENRNRGEKRKPELENQFRLCPLLPSLLGGHMMAVVSSRRRGCARQYRGTADNFWCCRFGRYWLSLTAGSSVLSKRHGKEEVQ